MSDFTMLMQLLNTQSNDRDFFTNLKILIDLIVPQAYRDVTHAEFYDNVGTLFEKLAKHTYIYTSQTAITVHMRNTLIKKIQKVIYNEKENPSSSKDSSSIFSYLWKT